MSLPGLERGTARGEAGSRSPKSSRFSRKNESGRTGQEVCREQGIGEQTLYRWMKKYGGMEASDAKRLCELEEENGKQKRIVADLTVAM